MNISKKYGRTYHYPFSPGTTNDDRINHDYWEDMEAIKEVVHTEKLDGENTCLNQYGVFARSHAAPTRHPWATYLKERWGLLKKDFGNLEFFGENIYAIHSIEYPNIKHHFYVFAIRELDQWLSWEEVNFYAAILDFSVVPVLEISEPTDKNTLEETILYYSAEESIFGSKDIHTGLKCSMEGIVTRNTESYSVADFSHNVFKYVRKDHVKTDEHWTRKWKRAPLIWEKPTN